MEVIFHLIDASGYLVISNHSLPTEKLNVSAKLEFSNLALSHRNHRKKKKMCNGYKKKYQATKSNVNRLVTLFKPFYEGLWRFIV